jgi:hypothetical protein
MIQLKADLMIKEISRVSIDKVIPLTRLSCGHGYEYPEMMP